MVRFHLVFQIRNERSTPQRFFYLSFCGLSFFGKKWVAFICRTFADSLKDFRAFFAFSSAYFSDRVSLVTIGLPQQNGGFSSEVPCTIQEKVDFQHFKTWSCGKKNRREKLSKINFSKTYLNTISATETIFFFLMTSQHDFKPNLDFKNLFS